MDATVPNPSSPQETPGMIPNANANTDINAVNLQQIQLQDQEPAQNIPRELAVTLKNSETGNRETKSISIPAPALPIPPADKNIIAEALHCLKNQAPSAPLPAERDGEGYKISFTYDSPSSQGAKMTLTAHLHSDNSLHHCSVRTPQRAVNASFGTPEQTPSLLAQQHSGRSSFERLLGSSSTERPKRQRTLSLDNLNDARSEKPFATTLFPTRQPVPDAQKHLDIARQTLDSKVRLFEREAVTSPAVAYDENCSYYGTDPLPWESCAALYGAPDAPNTTTTPPDETVVFSAQRLAAIFGVQPEELPRVAILANNEAIDMADEMDEMEDEEMDDGLKFDAVRFSETDSGFDVQKLGSIVMDDEMANLNTLNNALTNYQRCEYFFRKLDIPLNDLSGYCMEQNPLTNKVELAHYDVVRPDDQDVPQEAWKLQDNPYTGSSEILDSRSRSVKSDKHVFEDQDVARKVHDKLTDIALAL
jgi:hypothetical protein